jgi:RNA polymerase sigma-70 factor (ECF subfamily)
MEPDASESSYRAIGPGKAERLEVSASSAQPSEPGDGALVRRAQRGERQAFDLLIRRYQRQAVSVSYRLLDNMQDALEVTQDAFLKGFTSLGTLQNPDAFAGWLMRIVSNLSLNYRRARKSRSSLPLEDLLVGSEGEGHAGGADWAASGGNPEHNAEGHELGRGLKQALAQLPEKQRMAIVLFTIEELPQKQVAEAMECSVEAVKWHVFQARKRLRELLKEHLEE